MVLKKDKVSKSEQGINTPAVNTLPFGYSTTGTCCQRLCCHTSLFSYIGLLAINATKNLFNRSQFMAQTSAYPTAKGDPRQER